jgi:alkylation response protein AidB-like acyl-CoA dehydrogenase
VPRELALDPFGPPQPMAHAAGRVPLSPNVGAGLAAQTLGLARAALDAIDEQARTAVTPGPMPDLRDRADAQAGIVVHEAAVAASRGHLHRTVDALWRRAEAGDEARPADVAAAYGAAAHAMRVSRAAVDALSALGGTRALYVDSPLERIHRDLHAMLRHIVASPAFVEDAGRARFGLATQVPWYPI